MSDNQSPPDSPLPPKPEKDAAAVSLGRRGGLKGGKIRAANMTPEQRSEVAKKAAAAGKKAPKKAPAKKAAKAKKAPAKKAAAKKAPAKKAAKARAK